MVDFAYPMKMGVSNSMPGLFLVPLIMPGQAPSFVDFMFIRAVVVGVFIFLIVNRLNSLQPRASMVSFIGALGLVLIFWGSEWSYTLLISSFVPALGIALATLAMAKGEASRNGVYLIFALIAISKAPIAGVAVLTLIFMTFSKRWRPQPLIFFTAGLASFATLITWLTAARGVAANESTFSFMGLGVTQGPDQTLFSWRLFDWAASFTALPGWIVDYSATAVKANIEFMSPAVLVVVSAVSIAWVLGKYFLAYALLRKRALGPFMDKLGPIDIWVLFALVSFMFVRNGKEILWIGHQAHAFILVAIPTSILAIQWLLTKKDFLEHTLLKRWVVVATVFSIGIISSTSPMFSRLQSESAVSFERAYIEYRQLDVSDSFISSEFGTYSRLQVIAAITESKFRFNRGLNSSSQVDQFLVDP
jgi:hypothetical protein